ncbi:hypothetical protein HanRHA438_Chr17g0793531 [Helianthus annuus]|nr:hypothetical protein HanPI659440_Chr17g0664531 [Helianthus annuus]KAJ0824540.1 hypothetical protein HanRHA438_Chr17g0793531 [Helianthus annuus]
MRSLQCCFLLIIGCLVSQIYVSSDAAAAAILYDKFFFEGNWIVSEKKGDHHSGKIIIITRLRLIWHTKVYFFYTLYTCFLLVVYTVSYGIMWVV